MLQIDIDHTERIATLTLDRPDKRNALSLELMERLECALADIGRRRDVAVVILGANGSVFSSGHDLGELVDRSVRDYQQVFDLGIRESIAFVAPTPELSRALRFGEGHVTPRPSGAPACRGMR